MLHDRASTVLLAALAFTECWHCRCREFKDLIAELTRISSRNYYEVFRDLADSNHS